MIKKEIREDACAMQIKVHLSGESESATKVIMDNIEQSRKTKFYNIKL